MAVTGEVSGNRGVDDSASVESGENGSDGTRGGSEEIGEGVEEVGLVVGDDEEETVEDGTATGAEVGDTLVRSCSTEEWYLLVMGMAPQAMAFIIVMHPVSG